MERRAQRSTALLLLLLPLLATLARGQDCSKIYNKGGRGLLFGGLRSCAGGSCPQSRTDYWGRTCAFDGGSGWGVCNEKPANHAFEYAKTLGGGEILNLTPCDLLPYLRGRTLWLLGDSHSKSLYRALQCFLIDFWDHTECETSPDTSAVQALFNLPERQGNQKCFHLLGTGGGRVCMVEVVLGTSLLNNKAVANGGVLPLLRSRFAERQDIFYVNFGVWHKKRPEWEASLRPALTALGEYYQNTRSSWPHMLFRETPAEHPRNNNGGECQPMRGYTYNKGTGQLKIDATSRLNVKGWNSGANLNAAASDVLGRYGMAVVPAFAISVPLHDNHIGWKRNPELDCLHYCQPGAPQMWVWYMYDAFRAGKAGVRPLLSSKLAMESSRSSYTCVASSTRFRRRA